MTSPLSNTDENDGEYRVLWHDPANTSPDGRGSSQSRGDPVVEEMPASPSVSTHSVGGQSSQGEGCTKRMTHRNIRYNWRACSNEYLPSTDRGRNQLQSSPTRRGGRQVSQRHPRPRFGHTAVVYKDTMVTFGGRDGGTFFNDVWSYSFAQQQWDAPWDCTGENVTPRCGHTATIVHDRWMIVIGGCVGVSANACVGDVWCLDLHHRVWRRHIPRPTSSVYSGGMFLYRSADSSPEYYYHSDPTASFDPNNFTTTIVQQPRQRSTNTLAPRKGHTTVNVDDKFLIVFGGTSGIPARDDATTWCLNLQHNRWSIIHATGQHPEPRMYHIAELTERNTMLVFGGKLSDRHFSDDLYELVLPARLTSGSSASGEESSFAMWRRIEVTTSVRPTARFCSSSVYLNGILCVFLGGSECYHDDSYEFDFSTEEWRVGEGTGLPACTRPTIVHHDNTITFFGGCTSQNACMNVVMQLGLESPSLKELCREWVRNRTDMVVLHKPSLSAQTSPAAHHTPLQRNAGEETEERISAFHGVVPPCGSESATHHLPDALLDYLGASE